MTINIRDIIDNSIVHTYKAKTELFCESCNKYVNYISFKDDFEIWVDICKECGRDIVQDIPF